MKKLITCVVIVVLIIAGIIGYNRFMHGNLKIDRELVSDENLNLLADNWEKLRLYGEPQPMDDTDWLSLAIKGAPENALVYLYVNTGDAAEESPFASFLEDSATYDRYDLMDVLEDYADDHEVSCFGKSYNSIFVSNSCAAILWQEWNAKANADAFEAWFSDLLQDAQS